MISVSLKSAARWCVLSFLGGAFLGPAFVPVAVAFVMEQLRRYGALP
jgi:queuine/archaeosine tRNA-ribosyltransferase